MKARLPQGYGGGAQNMNAMIRQAQKMQEEMGKKQEELAARQFSITAGGGMIEVAANGAKELLSIKIKPEVIDPDDVEMLEDLIVAAVNEVLRKIEETSSVELGEITGGLNMPGIF